MELLWSVSVIASSAGERLHPVNFSWSQDQPLTMRGCEELISLSALLGGGVRRGSVGQPPPTHMHPMRRSGRG
eukprot:3143993-Prymnesium_polylepis.3